MFFDSIAYAQDAAGAAGPLGQLGPLGSFLPLIVIFVVFYFLLIRPQQKRQKQYAAMLDSIKTGDSVLTNGGIYGIVISVVDAQTFMVEVANGVKVKVAKSGIASKIEPMTTVSETTQEKK